MHQCVLWCRTAAHPDGYLAATTANPFRAAPHGSALVRAAPPTQLRRWHDRKVDAILGLDSTSTAGPSDGARPVQGTALASETDDGADARE